MKTPHIGMRKLLTAMLLGVLATAPAHASTTPFGGRPNPDGSVNAGAPMQTEVQPERAETVLNHPRPDYDPGAMKMGSFNLFPSIEAGVGYDSNIFGTRQATSDEIYTLHPSLTAQSDWSRHFVSLTVNGDMNFHRQYDSQNLHAIVAQGEGRYDLAEQTWVGGRGGYQQQYVPRANLDNNPGNQPTAFNLYTAGLSAYRGAGLLHAQMDYDFSRYDYTESPALTNGVGSLNRNENTVGGKLTYAASENIRPYVAVKVNSRDYNENTARSSDGIKADWPGTSAASPRLIFSRAGSRATMPISARPPRPPMPLTSAARRYGM